MSILKDVVSQFIALSILSNHLVQFRWPVITNTLMKNLSYKHEDFEIMRYKAENRENGSNLYKMLLQLI